MAAKNTFQFIYDPTVIQRIRQLNANLQAEFANLTWVWGTTASGRTVQAILEENERLVFEEGQNRWTPISAKYRAAKLRQGYDPRILIRTGRMKEAATVSGSADNISFGDANNYYYGVNAENFRRGGWSYPEIHQLGRGVVARRFVFLHATAARLLRRFFGQAVEDKLQELANRSKLRGMQFRKGLANRMAT